MPSAPVSVRCFQSPGRSRTRSAARTRAGLDSAAKSCAKVSRRSSCSSESARSTASKVTVVGWAKPVSGQSEVNPSRRVLPTILEPGHEAGRHDPGERRRPHHRAAERVRESHPEEVGRSRAALRLRREAPRANVDLGGRCRGHAVHLRGRDAAERGVGSRSLDARRDAPRLLRQRGARSRHGRERHPRLDVLPVVRGHGRQVLRELPGPRARLRLSPGVQRLAHRRMGGQPPGPLHPAPALRALVAGALGAGGAARGAQGRHRDRVLRGAREVRLSEHPQRRVGSVLRRVPGTRRGDRDPHRVEQA